jgi:Spy/CpxP family protein refolding chaperone
MKTLRTCVLLAVAMLVALPVMAADKKPAAKKPAKCPAAAYVERMLQGITLTEDQKAKLGEIQKEFGPKLVDASKKRQAILTPEQRKAEAEAAKAARAEGKKGKDLMQAVQNAVKPSDEQKAKLAEVQKERAALEKGLREKAIGVLTAEQKAQLKKAQPKKAAK